MNSRSKLWAFFGLLFILLCLDGPGSFAQTATGTADVERIKAETQKLQAEKNKLEAEAAYFAKAPWINLIQNVVGFLAISIPITIGIAQLHGQRLMSKERAKVDASLKAAEIAMNAPTTGQLRSRATILGKLLKDFVPDFGKNLESLDFKKIGYASYRARFTSLLDAISNNPEKALMLTQTYNVLFPDDDENTGGRIKKLLQHLEHINGAAN